MRGGIEGYTGGGAGRDARDIIGRSVNTLIVEDIKGCLGFLGYKLSKLSIKADY